MLATNDNKVDCKVAKPCMVCPCSCCGRAVERITPYGDTKPYCTIYNDFHTPFIKKFCTYFEPLKGDD